MNRLFIYWKEGSCIIKSYPDPCELWSDLLHFNSAQLNCCKMAPVGWSRTFFFLTLSLFLLPSFIHRQSSIKHQLEYDCLHYDSFYLNENKSSRLIVVVSCLLGRFTSQRRRAHFIETHLNRMFGLFPLLFFSTRSSVFFYRSNSTKKKLKHFCLNIYRNSCVSLLDKLREQKHTWNERV